VSYAQPSGDGQAMVVVKHQKSARGPLWRVCVFVNGARLIRPGFQKDKAAINLAAMLVQQMLVHGWQVRWQVLDKEGKDRHINLAALGKNMMPVSQRKEDSDAAKP
jgi:hypothetical protein